MSTTNLLSESLKEKKMATGCQKKKKALIEFLISHVPSKFISYNIPISGHNEIITGSYEHSVFPRHILTFVVLRVVHRNKYLGVIMTCRRYSALYGDGMCRRRVSPTWGARARAVF